MLTLERLVREVAATPLLVRIGLVVMALGGLGDVVAHLGAPEHAGHLQGHTGDELWAHLLGFVGMVLVLAGVVIDGVQRTRPGRPAGNAAREFHDAAR